MIVMKYPAFQLRNLAPYQPLRIASSTGLQRRRSRLPLLQRPILTDPALRQDAPTSIPHETSFCFGPEGLRPGWGLLLFTALFAALLATGGALAHHLRLASPRHTVPREQSPSGLFIGEAILFTATTLATGIMSRMERRPFTAYGIGGTRKLPHFLAGLAWGVGFLSLLVFTLRLTGLLVFNARLLSGVAILRFGALWLAGFLLVAGVEETLLRGYLQATLTRGLTGIFGSLEVAHASAWGFWTAAVLLSVLFGATHRSNPGESPLGLLSATLAGLVFCLSLRRTGSLWWAIGFHATWDWGQSFLYGVADSGAMVQFHLFATHPAGKPLLSGGTTGPEGSLFILPILGFVALVIQLTLARLPTRSSS